MSVKTIMDGTGLLKQNHVKNDTLAKVSAASPGLR